MDAKFCLSEGAKSCRVVYACVYRVLRSHLTLKSALCPACLGRGGVRDALCPNLLPGWCRKGSCCLTVLHLGCCLYNCLSCSTKLSWLSHDGKHDDFQVATINIPSVFGSVVSKNEETPFAQRSNSVSLDVRCSFGAACQTHNNVLWVLCNGPT
eukprot:scpid91187/ scgid13794/ 